MEHRLGLIGCGTVGQGLLQILHDKKDFLHDAFGFEARVVAISDKLKGTLIVPEGIDIPAVLALLAAGYRADGGRHACSTNARLRGANRARPTYAAERRAHIAYHSHDSHGRPAARLLDDCAAR